MKKITKKFTPIFLLLIILITAAIPAADFCVSADDSGLKHDGDFGYYVIRNTASISEYTGSGGDVVVPSTLGGLPVNIISSNVFSMNDKIKNVTISEGIKTLSDNAFYGCSALTQISIPSSVTEIIGNVFLGCINLKNLEIDQNNTVYKSVDGVVFSKDLKKLFFCSPAKRDTYNIPDGVTDIGTRAFKECTNLKNIIFPNSIININSNSFEGCSGLTDVILGENVETISGSAFKGCSGLTEIIIPEKVKLIDSSAFEECSALADIMVSDSVEIIGRRAFHNTSWYESQPDGLVYIGKIAYVWKGSMPENTEIIIKEGTKSITAGAFSRCYTLVNVKMPDSLTDIGYEAFENCTGLKNAKIGNGVINIRSSAFYRCTELTEITIPDSVIIINNSAFFECSKLTKLTLRNNLSIIGDNAFGNCTELLDISIPESVFCIGYSAFQNTAWYNNQPDGFLYVGNILYEYKGKMPDLTEITIKEGTKTICDSALSYSKQLTLVTIPDSVKRIDRYAFSDCSKLTRIKLPENLEFIGYAAFIRTGIKTIHIPGSVTYIADRSIGYEMEQAGATGPDNKVDGFIITGTKGSEAEKYALKFGFSFLNSEADINGDGMITAADALLVLQYSVKKINFTDAQKELGDINYDDNINASDALLFLQCAVGKIDIG